MSSGMTGASQSSKPLSPRLRSPPPSIVIQQIDDDDEDGLDLDLNNNTATNKIITSPTHREQELAMTLDDQDNSSEDEAIPKCSKGPLPIDWVLEPRDLIPPSFQPGSLNDEDWKDHDEALGNGIENSYGIVIASAGQASRDRVAVIDKALKKSAVQGIVDERIVTPVRRSSFGAGHEPPTPGSSESVPQKGILVSKSRYKGLSTKGGLTYSTKSNASVASEKRIQFGEDKVQVFSIVDDENANDNDHHQPNEHHNNQSSQLLSTAPINNNSLSSNSGTNNFSSLVGQPSNTMLMYSSDGASNNNPFGNPFNTMNSFANASSASTQGSAAVSNSSLSTETVHAFNNLSGSTGVQPSPGFQLNSNATMGLASNIMGSTVPNAFSGSSVPAWGMGLSNTFGAGIGSMDSSLKNISSRPTDAVASPFNNTPPFKKQPLLDNDQGLTDLARPVSPRASTADNNFPAFSMSPSFVQPIPPSDKPVSLRPQVGSTNNFINSSSAFDLSGLSNTLVYNNGEDGHSTPKKSESPTNLSTMPRYYPKNSDLIPIDISAEVESEIDASSTGSAGKTNTGPNWQLCFYRFKCLDDVEKFLEAVLVEDELFEVFDLYSSTKPDGEDTVLKMQLLRGWKKFQADSSGVEELLAGFTDVLNINEVDEQEIPDILEEHQMELETLFNELAYHCMPDFIASNSFGTYFDTQAALKANNKILRIDSKVLHTVYS